MLPEIQRVERCLTSRSKCSEKETDRRYRCARFHNPEKGNRWENCGGDLRCWLPLGKKSEFRREEYGGCPMPPRADARFVRKSRWLETVPVPSACKSDWFW